MRTLSGKTSICRSSGIFQMLINFRWGSFPAEYKTITSVPPAMGSHWAGSLANRERTPCRFPGDTNLYSAGSALILQLFALPRPPLRKSACNPCSGKDCPQAPLVSMLEPLACATGTRQLFTSMPSNRTKHEPHSPSPHPSFAPVNFKSFRSTSNNLSMGWARSFFASPLTVNETSHFARAAGEGFMLSLASKKEHLAQEPRAAECQRYLRVASGLNGSEHRSHPRRRLRSPAQAHPWGALRCPWRRARRRHCQAPQKIPGSAGRPPKSA